MTTEITTPAIFSSQREGEAVALLRTYFGLDDSRAFAGASFDSIGADETDPDDITPVDLVSLATLSVGVKGYPAIELLSPSLRNRARELLREIPVEASIGTPGAMEHLAEDRILPATQLWRLIFSVKGLHNVSTSKLLARKRPALFPIYDTVINSQLALGGTTAGLWTKFHEWVNRDEHGTTVFKRAENLKAAADLPRHITPLRTIDVVLWMDGRN